ncbi:MAG: helix-turn-helix domain-containing protein [Thaumarchaeota archaeon]|nr:helix-turn-helix domain-containing protein [Nitrososphaerota archaeon]
MRRIALEISNTGRTGANSFFEKVVELEIIHNLRSDSSGIAGIWKIVLRDPRASPRTLLRSEAGNWWSAFSRIKVLSKGPEGIVAYVEMGPDKTAPHGRPLEVHFISMGYRNGKVRLVVLGDTGELRRLLHQMTEDGMEYKVLDVSDARFEPNSPLSGLTPAQRKTILTAFDGGYYDLPRRIDSSHIAMKLGLDKSTVAEHLRKAERTMMRKAIGGDGKP